MHLADAFIQSDLQCIQAIHLFCQYVCSLGIEPTTFALHAATQCSNHWATGTHIFIQWGKKVFSQPPIVQVLPLKKMREACNFHHRYTSTICFHTLLLVFWPIPPCRSPLEQWCFGTFNSLQRFSMGLRSGDWLGHSRTLKCFLRSHSFVARAVCLGSLSCWKTQSSFIFNGWGFRSKSHDTWPHSFFPLHRSVVMLPLQKNSPKAWCFHPHASQ